MAAFLTAKSWLSSLSDSDIEAIVDVVNTDGIYSGPQLLSDDELKHMQAFVTSTICEAGHETVSLSREQARVSGLNDLPDSGEFSDFIRRLYAAGYGAPTSDFEVHQVLRCLTGRTAAVHSWNFHYDSYVITALIPIEIPADGMRGDFLLIPNTRQIRSNYARNLVDKVLLDNAWTQKMLRKRVPAADRMKRVHLTPGHLYLFWGYRSIHTNEEVSSDSVRATALFHYVDPHAHSSLKRRLRGA